MWFDFLRGSLASIFADAFHAFYTSCTFLRVVFDAVLATGSQGRDSESDRRP